MLRTSVALLTYEFHSKILPRQHPCVFSSGLFQRFGEAGQFHGFRILRRTFPLAVACELKKGPLIYALSQYCNLILFPINPSSRAKYRKAFFLSGAKDDPGDAFLQTEMLEKHMDRLKPIEAESAEVRALAQLLEYRRILVQNRVDLTNSITTTLKNYNPQVLDWFNEKDTHIFCDFVIKWPSLPQVKRARKKALVEFFNAYNAR